MNQILIRFFDILSSLFGITILLPVFLIISIVISIESSGGPFYLQTRIGKKGKEFKLIKFRSMVKDTDKKSLITVKGNPGITKSGKFIRKYKIDELPQLINVLIGEMSLVGPRPEVSKYVSLYTKEQLKVLNIKPGITDYASIEFSNENELLAQTSNSEKMYIEEIMPQKLNLNKKYIENYNLKEYFKIILLTIKKVLM